MLYYAICIASGNKVFGIADVPEPKKVLIIDEETGIDEIKKRIVAMKKGLGIKEENLPIAYISFAGLKLDKIEKQKRILDFISEFQPDIIFVDCLQRVLSFNIDKENQLISEFMTEFVRPSITKYGCSWVFIHHYRKSPTGKRPDDWLDEIRGGTELVNYCRFIFGLKRPRGQSSETEDQIIFKQLKMSNAPPTKDKVISFVNNGDSLKIEYVGEADEVLATEQLCAEAIKEWILEEGIKGEFRTKDVKEAEPKGYKYTTISSGLKVLVENGFLERVKQGYYKVSGKEQQNSLKGGVK